VKGKVDRVDMTPEGLMLVEYKTISSRPTAAKDATGKTNLDVQLPLYVQAAAPALDGERPVAGAYYYSLTAAKPLKKVNTVKIDDGELAHFAERIKGQLQQGRYTVEPDRDRNACNYCSFDAVCRQGKRLERKGSDARVGSDR
jgi:ATP-dependent helicase/DNAse subunit B